MRTGRILSLAGALVGLVLFAGLAGAGSGVTLGTLGADTACAAPADLVVVQTGVSGGPSNQVPSGKWVVTSWSAAGGNGGQEALVIFRPTGTPDEYKVVGSSSAQELDEAMNTRFKVQGGDLLGFWAQINTLCARTTGSPGDTISVFFPIGVPAAGDTITTFQAGPGYRLNMRVTLEPRSGK